MEQMANRLVAMGSRSEARPPMTIFYGKTVCARVAFCLSRESVGILA
jgi:hypothetical protein